MSPTSKLWGAPLGTLAIMSAVATLDAPGWVVDLTKLWGPAFLILSFVPFGFVYFIPRTAIPDFIQAQKDQAVALSRISQSLTEISGHNGKLDSILESQREIQLDLRIGAERFKRLEEMLLHDVNRT